MEGLLRSNVTVLIAFKGVNPINWSDFSEGLKEHEYSTFGQGVAFTNNGNQTPAFIASTDVFQWLYTPSNKHLVLRGSNQKETVEHFKGLLELVQRQFKGSKWKKNFRFYEIHTVNEIEPDRLTPMEIMKRIAPENSLDHFEGAFGDRKPVMYAFRLSSWDGEVPSSLRESIPWYEMSFQPMIDNTDRVICEIVSRNADLDEAETMANKLSGSINSFIERYDTGG
jgi:hypothetical protein